jgi:hypothetical protein
MASRKPARRNGMFIAVVFKERIQPGTFEFAQTVCAASAAPVQHEHTDERAVSRRGRADGPMTKL